ncbi:TOBE domain-containing protein [Streptomyces diastatochromogenes]|nr:TOBE domain-containing protein [Streptomyces diastatochromogenes]
MQSYSIGRASRLPGVRPDTARRPVSLLIRGAVEQLGLEVGMQATARVKSTSVHIDRT